jgi:hypothetical protein
MTKVGDPDVLMYEKYDTEWRVITATEPERDGEPILLYKMDEPRSGEYTVAGYWGEYPGRGECWIASGGQPLGWLSQVTNTPQGYPTHWKPVPAPPKITRAEYWAFYEDGIAPTKNPE